jgi:predicted nuclease with RNAse H fold
LTNDPLEHLREELRRLDLLLHRQVLRLRASYGLSLDEFRGLYVSDEQVDSLVGPALRAEGFAVREAYPFATLRLLGLPTGGKRTPLGRLRIHHALQALVPGLDHPTASEHQLDAVVCAYTAQLWRQGRTRTVGAPDEGLMTIPDVALGPPLRSVPPRARRAAEPKASYAPDRP